MILYINELIFRLKKIEKFFNICVKFNKNKYRIEVCYYWG